ncbi:hypothetical protein M011DRAFT_472069 [Sporormia fimetaria CBS 119925]|uniref:Uncharacterized protein n=1 Tax=Sporormia fimetaria CBS 119925 TaxID=1340428 RepID=A0A6A6UYZ5_9PLEO|nr:hypothetical protein M011DRAFT_472069 [Sporormia fimetaria CBS 119925]
MDPVLSLQGIGWVLRKTVGAATITQHIRTTTTPEGHTNITFDQILTGGLKGTTENRTLDWTYRPHSDWLFGDVRGKSRWVTLEKYQEEYAGKGDEAVDEDVKYLVDGWDEETKGAELVESYVENDDAGWIARQLWGFAMVDGQRMHVRRVVVRKGKEVRRIRLVYTWQGEL